MPKKIHIDDDALREAVRTSTSFFQVAKKVAPNPRGLYNSVIRRIKMLGLDTSHFESVPRRAVPRDVAGDAHAPGGHRDGLESRCSAHAV